MNNSNRVREYVLDEKGNPRPARDWREWGDFMEKGAKPGAENPRILKRTHINPEVMVSTVFLALDHNPWGTGAPILWETMVFGGPHNGDMRRYTTKKSALKGHTKIVNIIRNEK